MKAVSIKTNFEFSPDIQQMVAEHFPDWQKQLTDAARNKLLDLLIVCFEQEKKRK